MLNFKSVYFNVYLLKDLKQSIPGFLWIVFFWKLVKSKCELHKSLISMLAPEKNTWPQTADLLKTLFNDCLDHFSG